MISANAFISVRGNRVHVAAFTRNHLDKAVEQVKADFVVIYQCPVFRSTYPEGFNTELVVDLRASVVRENARLSNASK